MTDHELEVQAANDKLILVFLDSFSHPCTNAVADDLLLRLVNDWPDEQGTTFRQALFNVWKYFTKTKGVDGE